MSEPGINDAAMPEQAPNNHPVLVSPGAQLAAYRQERGWTIEQVASHLNLAPRQVSAIEADDYPSLPGMAIVRGFVRQYAKLLKVDAAPLLASLGGETVLAHESIRPRQSLSAPFSEARLPSMNERQRPSRWVFGVLLLVLAAAGVWVLLKDKNLSDMSEAATSQVKSGIAQITTQGGTDQTAASDAATASPTPSASASSLPAAPTSASEFPGGPSASATTQADNATPITPPVSAATTVPAPTQSDNKPIVSSQPANVSSAVATSPAIAATGAVNPGQDTLLIKARQDSWVEIKPAGAAKPAVSRLLKSGDSETFEVTGPVSVVIGNASGVDASLRGSSIELKTPGNGNVARLTLK